MLAISRNWSSVLLISKLNEAKIETSNFYLWSVQTSGRRMRVNDDELLKGWNFVSKTVMIMLSIEQNKTTYISCFSYSGFILSGSFLDYKHYIFYPAGYWN